MRKSNWIISPSFRVNIKNIWVATTYLYRCFLFSLRRKKHLANISHCNFSLTSVVHPKLPAREIDAWIQRVALGLVLIRPEAAAVQGQILFVSDGLRSRMQHFYCFSTPVVQKTFRYIYPSWDIQQPFSPRQYFWVDDFPFGEMWTRSLEGITFSKVIQHLNFKLKISKGSQRPTNERIESGV